MNSSSIIELANVHDQTEIEPEDLIENEPLESITSRQTSVTERNSSDDGAIDELEDSNVGDLNETTINESTFSDAEETKLGFKWN